MVVGLNLQDPVFWTKDADCVQQVLKNFTLQNVDSLNFEVSKRTTGNQNRFCSKSFFFKTMKNGEKVRRDWLVFSESTGNVYCLYCKLFSSSCTLLTEGFCGWKKGSERLENHEQSLVHLENLKCFVIRKSEKTKKIDEELKLRQEYEFNYWRSILQRILSVIKFLASRGLPFRGKDEILGSKLNGNYLGLLELLSQYDPILRQHIKKYGAKGTGSVSYLSSTICNEFIQILADFVLREIVNQIHQSKYYSISVDSTPDITHVDQLTFILRYCSTEGKPKERFVKFLDRVGHKAAEMEDAVLNTLIELNLDINDCRGQSYDNANNMSGIYNGLQAKIKSKNKLAFYVPCAAHSLNLVVQNSADSCLEATDFFSTVEEIYVFFSSSTYRWKLLLDAPKPNLNFYVPKRINITRWSSRFDALKALKNGFNQFKDALSLIVDSSGEKNLVRCQAKGLGDKMESLEFGILVVFWYDILERCHKTSQSLQAEDIDLSVCTSLYNSLYDYVQSIRDKFFFYEKEGKLLSQINDYKESSARQKKRKLQHDEKNTEAILTPEEKFRTQVFYKIMDNLLRDLKDRGAAYFDIELKFSFLLNLQNLDDKVISERCHSVLELYPNDLQEGLENECIQLKYFVKSFTSTLEENCKNAVDLMQLLHKYKITPSFPNIEILLRIFLCLMITNATGERSFSILKKTKNYQRNSLMQENLNALATLCINSDLLEELNFDSIIDEFARRKSRKVNV